MKNLILTLSLVFATAAMAAKFPLEWNVNYDTSVPYEVEIQPAKLVKLGLMKAGDGFKVYADGKELAVKVIEGKAPGSIRLRFSVPQGTKKLECETVGGK